MNRCKHFRTNPALALLLGLALLLMGLPLGAKPSSPAWENFAGQFLETYLGLHPSFAASAGRHEFDGRLPDWSGTGLGKLQQWLESERSKALAYTDQDLKEPERFERDYLVAVIDEELFWMKTARSPYRNPMYYMGSLDPNFYVNRPYAPIEQRLRGFIEYARNVPRAAEQIRANLKPPFPHAFIDFGKTVFGGLAKFYENDAKSAFAAVADPQLQKQFQQALPLAAKSMRDLADWLELQRPSANDDFALGPDLFREMLRATEQVDAPLDVLEKLAKDDLQRNLDALKEECGRYAPGATVPACVQKVESRKPPEGTLAEARKQLAALKGFILAKNIVTIPSQEEAMVAETPPYKRWNSAYIDAPGPFERGLPSVYYVAPPDPAWTPAEQAAYIPSTANLLFISAHEVWPGHFLQHLHAHKVASKFGQLFTGYAFSEGWAHYAEELMWESGLNAGDAETHIGQLQNALLRNVRFLSAIGLHTQGMTVEASQKMFRELAFKDEGNARQQAARGTFDPAYLNYTLGKLMIRKLRADWTATRGGREAWRQFHDQFLSYGAPPIPLVRKAMMGGSGQYLQ